jgi:hypothetical protein
MSTKYFSEKISSPSGCPTGVDRVSLEMITKILIAIKAATRHLRPQTQFPSRFARQAEFRFANEFSPIANFAKSINERV